jgi:hypothetical protein
MGKCMFILDRLPGFLEPAYVHRGGNDPLISIRRNGNTISGRMSSISAWHGARLRRLAFDEAARIPKLDQHLIGGEGATDELVVFSTPAFGLSSTFFERMIGGKESPVVPYSPGIARDRGRWVSFRWDWRDDPRKSAEWARDKRSSMGEAAFEEQYGCSFEATFPGRIWPELSTADNMLTAGEWREVLASGWLEKCRIVEAWDVGLATAVVWIAHNQATDDLLVVGGRGWWDATTEQIEADLAEPLPGVADGGWRTESNPGGRLPELRVADPAIFLRRGGDARCIADDLAAIGVHLQARSLVNRIEAMRRLVRRMIIERKLTFAPTCETGYVQGRGETTSPWLAARAYARKVAPDGSVMPDAIKNHHSHFADTIMYGVDWALNEVRARMRRKLGGGWGDVDA